MMHQPSSKNGTVCVYCQIKLVMMFFNSFSILLLLLIAGSQQAGAQQRRSVLRSNADSIAYTIDGKKSTWRLARPAVLEIPVGAKQMSRVTFKTDVDSLSYLIKLNQKIRMVVLYKGDSIRTQLTGVQKNEYFSAAYIKQHRGKFDVQIPEVQELAKIMVALTDVGSTDSNITNMRTAYYNEVKGHFTPFRKHPMIDTINKYLTGKVSPDSSYWHYYAWKMNANAYTFNNAGKIVNKGSIRYMGFRDPGAPGDPFVKYADLVADFAAKSGFRKFYAAHKPYYDSLLTTYVKYVPLQDMKSWLEAHYPYKYDYFLITFSPLTAGAHSTGVFEDNGFNQTVMFVAGTSFNSRYSQAVNEMQNSRVVFTEIDHNYDNPVSNTYAREINDAMKDKAKWGKDIPPNSAYDSPMSIFKEYMTWALFSLYCLDRYPENEVLTFVDRMERQMERNRDFNNFKAFNRELMRLYLHHNRKKKAHELYPEIIEWCKRQ